MFYLQNYLQEVQTQTVKILIRSWDFFWLCRETFHHFIKRKIILPLVFQIVMRPKHMSKYLQISKINNKFFKNKISVFITGPAIPKSIVKTPLAVKGRCCFNFSIKSLTCWCSSSDEILVEYSNRKLFKPCI